MILKCFFGAMVRDVVSVCVPAKPLSQSNSYTALKIIVFAYLIESDKKLQRQYKLVNKIRMLLNEVKEVTNICYHH